MAVPVTVPVFMLVPTVRVVSGDPTPRRQRDIRERRLFLQLRSDEGFLGLSHCAASRCLVIARASVAPSDAYRNRHAVA